MLDNPGEMNASIGLGMKADEILAVHEDVTLLLANLGLSGYTHSSAAIQGLHQHRSRQVRDSPHATQGQSVCQHYLRMIGK
jgi:hypothetical protein